MAHFIQGLLVKLAGLLIVLGYLWWQGVSFSVASVESAEPTQPELVDIDAHAADAANRIETQLGRLEALGNRPPPDLDLTPLPGEPGFIAPPGAPEIIALPGEAGFVPLPGEAGYRGDEEQTDHGVTVRRGLGRSETGGPRRVRVPR
ncbi:hypothetical protein VK792_03470 [Mesobacterium sp. TK19101]|uniref:Uncharacterized protein n=1 Tax=Mesobacterium hydrothermale TaxID=3111907 RepID=A0ABU6HCZ5_9RHOB|nr:hypothetical protein [Mesobacterium sp. TK19101]MEC3860332.1 hypothetical protein [Mesobacterium sp. TK19101]